MMKVLSKRPDGSFVAEVDGLPYHVTKGDDLYAAALEAGADAPTEPDASPPTIEQRRSGADLRRRDFCLALKRAGILPDSEAISAAKGEWPATFRSALDQMPNADHVEAEIIWADTPVVNRVHPLVLMVQAAGGLTDAQVDDLFGLV